MPHIIYTDNGQAFNTEQVKKLCEQHGLQLVATPPGKPRGTATVERYFHVLHRMVITRLPGHAGSRGASLTLDELRDVIAAFIREYVHRQRVGDGQPFTSWKQGPYDRLHPNGHHGGNADGPAQ